jgi:hypothetical protein
LPSIEISREKHLTDNNEETLLTPTNQIAQSLANESSHVPRTSVMDVSTDEADVRIVVEEQVCLVIRSY